jgi:hypothetical protein
MQISHTGDSGMNTISSKHKMIEYATRNQFNTCQSLQNDNNNYHLSNKLHKNNPTTSKNNKLQKQLIHLINKKLKID